jgi:hypothetical protein
MPIRPRRFRSRLCPAARRCLESEVLTASHKSDLDPPLLLLKPPVSSKPLYAARRRHKLLDEISNMLAEMRRTMLGAVTSVCRAVVQQLARASGSEHHYGTHFDRRVRS